MRVLVDYRAALRERSGVGEYTHQLVAALLRRVASNGARATLDLWIFSSSWKDRLVVPAELAGVHAVDRRVPVSVLNFAWHRLGWPPAERLAGADFDVTHALHPLMLPSRHAAPMITIHDLTFLTHPERTRAEIRRDYPALVREHAHRAARILTISEFTAGEIVARLGVSRDKITVGYPGAPPWTPIAQPPKDGYVLFLGTLEPRKNVGGLLDAYTKLVNPPPLVLAGKATEEAREWLARIERPPLTGLVRHVGYVEPDRRCELYAGARLLVQPSFEEGFGMPVLEAMTLGIPVVAANRGALPEVLGDAGLLVDPERPAEIADAIQRMLSDAALADGCRERGLARARAFNWDETAALVHDAYRLACASA
ncbi:MAG TPA: glycosyltransferase family 1 protein [Vicinamibacterales bacterium]|nr:glycosyltransferase family 1 protein [Vicinamibacterales bacterium]